MKQASTVVFQSYRTRNVSGWIARCLTSVRQWAIQSGHDYHFVGDEFLTLVPNWYRAKAGPEICPVTDLARLLLARELLSRGYELAIWMDADVLVFDPDAMRLNLTRGFAFTHETWVYAGPSGKPVVEHKVNNAITLFARQNRHLDFFIDACLRIARAREQLGKFAVGTHFLSNLRRILPFPLVQIAGTLSAPLMREIAQDDRSDFLAVHGQALPQAIACANLCASLAWRDALGGLPEVIYEQAIERLLASRGEILNRHRTPQTAPA